MEPASTPPLEPLCAFCNDEVPAMDAIIYHGVVYHPACVALTTGRADTASARRLPGRRPAATGDADRDLCDG